MRRVTPATNQPMGDNDSGFGLNTTAKKAANPIQKPLFL
jgi:hypothetical protein